MYREDVAEVIAQYQTESRKYRRVHNGLQNLVMIGSTAMTTIAALEAKNWNWQSITAYFQSRRERTACAACRSRHPSAGPYRAGHGPDQRRLAGRSEPVGRTGLRRSRYRGLAKTRLQHHFTGAAVNLARVDAWLTGRPLARTRVSPFAALRPAG